MNADELEYTVSLERRIQVLECELAHGNDTVRQLQQRLREAQRCCREAEERESALLQKTDNLERERQRQERLLQKHRVRPRRSGQVAGEVVVASAVDGAEPAAEESLSKAALGYSDGANAAELERAQFLNKALTAQLVEYHQRVARLEAVATALRAADVARWSPPPEAGDSACNVKSECINAHISGSDGSLLEQLAAERERSAALHGYVNKLLSRLLADPAFFKVLAQ